MSGAAPDPGRLTVIGVRHHSPACAGLVRRTVEALRPAFVLIEGPVDFNPHLPDLALGHDLPVAIFSFRADSAGSAASYTPFCAFSPEWQALEAGRAVGAETLFCDLPAWDPAFGRRANRYADPHGARAEAAERVLATALGVADQDALWDVLAEAAPEAELPTRLDRYFALLRPPGTDDPAEEARERFMGAYAAHALRAAGDRPVVLVCGGWHADAVRRHAARADGTRPEPAPPEPDLRTGSYVVPYAYPRLDRFSGYAAGMPAPGYYERVAAAGLAPAADWAMTAITAALREAGQVVSTADRVAWRVHAEALARLRAHPAILRADLIDAALAALVKDALDRPPAWAAGGAAPGHPALAAMLRALTGRREGRLAPGTRQPPLVADVAERLRAADLEPGPARRRIDLDWAEPGDRARAHLLHRLVLLGLPGIAREGPDRAEPGLPRERFTLMRHPHWLGALIEASVWGGTLEMAASARITARVEAEPDSLRVLTRALSDALFAGLTLEGELLARLSAGIAAAHDAAALGAAGAGIVRLYRFGDAFASARPALARLCAALAARALFVVEGIREPRAGLGAIPLVLACRDLFREAGADVPGLDNLRGPFAAMLGRRLADPETPPALAGAALGFRVACGAAGSDPEAALVRLRRFGLPATLGDFLAGLFALAREEIAADATLASVEGLVAAWGDADFLRALPSLRMAFSWFPPRERERIAVAILRRSGLGAARAEVEALAWMRQRARPADQAEALAREARVAARLARYGLT